MGYECPVCGDPQADAGHLANHLAFTALTSGGDHEAWLDDHVESWGEMGETELAEAVVDHAAETDFPQVFEESGVADHDHDDGHPSVKAARERADRELSDDDAEVLAEARDLTREMLDGDSAASEDETE
jgi:hypothetical protein